MLVKDPRKRPVFLSAAWRNLLFANYAIDPHVLMPFVPEGTTLDFHGDSCYISLVAFQFENTKVFGVPAFHWSNFDEINLRFYVSRPLSNGGEQTGVVFIKEIVPSRFIAWIARTLYGENYVAMDIDHEITIGQTLGITYTCSTNELSSRFSAVVSLDSETTYEEGLKPYITEHYWGYSAPDQNTTVEYEVKHPRWPVNRVMEHTINFDFESLYGAPFKLLSEIKPTSVFYCKGSDITVHLGSTISP